MAIEFRCNQCGKLLRTADETAGRMAQCPHCGSQTPIPFASSTIEVLPPETPTTGGDARTTDSGPSGESGNPFADAGGSSSPFGGSSPFGDSPFGSDSGENPYQSPQYTPKAVYEYSPDSVLYATNRVAGPALGLIIFGSLMLVIYLGVMVVSLFLPAIVGANNPGFQRMPNFANMQIGIQLASNAFGLALAILILVGGIKMRKLENYGLSMAGAIVAVLPCYSLCCLIGMPMGIWAIVVLCDAQVKAAFK